MHACLRACLFSAFGAMSLTMAQFVCGTTAVVLVCGKNYMRVCACVNIFKQRRVIGAVCGVCSNFVCVCTHVHASFVSALSLPRVYYVSFLFFSFFFFFCSLFFFIRTQVLVSGRLFAANVGDSRAVLCRQGQAMPITVDHTPRTAEEIQRLRALNGFVTV